MKTQVRINAEKDQKYNPYCMRCRGAVRMEKVAPFFWQCCNCGARHDEREPYFVRFTEQTKLLDEVPVIVGSYVVRGNAAAMWRILIHLGMNPNVTASIYYTDHTPANLEEFYEDITRDLCDMSDMPYPDFLTMVNRVANK